MGFSDQGWLWRIQPFVTVVCCCYGGFVSSMASAAAWFPNQQPLLLSWDYVYDFDLLPLKAELPLEPWSDDYWADLDGGINRRWPGGSSFALTPYLNTTQFPLLPEADLRNLSPAEKYDLWRGDFSLSTVQAEKQRIQRNANDGSPIQGWEGLCHGWANASFNFIEPHSVVMTNPQGVRIPFGASDVKALLTWFQAHATTPRRKIGSTCAYSYRDDGYTTHPDCNDTHAAAFHVILANQIGVQKRGFVIDIIPDVQVWNHPIFAFSSTIEAERWPSANAASDAVRELVVHTTVTFESEIKPAWEAGIHRSDSRAYRYTLELNANNEIVGGEWLPVANSSSDIPVLKPDTIWFWETPSFSGAAASMNELFQASTAPLQPGE